MAQRVCEKEQLSLRRRVPAGALLLTCLLAAFGCEQTTQHVVVKQPVPNPAPAQSKNTVGPMPEPRRVDVTAQSQAPVPAAAPTSAPTVQPSTVEQLAAQVEAALAAGENEYKDGHL